MGAPTLSDATLYGMTYEGGIPNSNGTGAGNVFSVGVDGSNYQNLVSFTGSPGTANAAQPFGSLTLGGATLYGMTRSGGADGLGNIFSVDTSGNYQNLLSFTGTGGVENGEYPQGNLLLIGTTLYGMTRRAAPTVTATSSAWESTARIIKTFTVSPADRTAPTRKQV